MKIKGVCDHHDLGCLGAAVNTRAIERQIEILKGMGVNAIRTSHNPPAPELLDLCDRMGMIVMDEAFDMWKKKKTEFDYALDWDAWHVRDLKDQVLRDRNHPSVMIWSIGNEVVEQWDSTGAGLSSRESWRASCGSSTPPAPLPPPATDRARRTRSSDPGALDLIGYNYSQNTFADFLKTFPDKPFLATETTSALATRGHYDLPSDSIRRWPRPVGQRRPDECRLHLFSI